MKKRNLLIVDDEEKFADMLARRLELRGCSCTVCFDGRSAMESLDEMDYLLILLDLRLPDLYGVDVLNQIRKIKPDIPVIIVTGHGTEKDRIACMDLGAHDFLHKPLEINTLMSIVDSIAEER